MANKKRRKTVMISDGRIEVDIASLRSVFLQEEWKPETVVGPRLS